MWGELVLADFSRLHFFYMRSCRSIGTLYLVCRTRYTSKYGFEQPRKANSNNSIAPPQARCGTARSSDKLTRRASRSRYRTYGRLLSQRHSSRCPGLHAKYRDLLRDKQYTLVFYLFLILENVKRERQPPVGLEPRRMGM